MLGTPGKSNLTELLKLIPKPDPEAYEIGTLDFKNPEEKPLLGLGFFAKSYEALVHPFLLQDIKADETMNEIFGKGYIDIESKYTLEQLKAAYPMPIAQCAKADAEAILKGIKAP